MFIDLQFITQPGKMYNRDLDGDGLPDVEAWLDRNQKLWAVAQRQVGRRRRALRPASPGLTPVKKPSMMDRMSKTMSFGKKRARRQGLPAEASARAAKRRVLQGARGVAQRSDSICPDDGPRLREAADL